MLCSRGYPDQFNKNILIPGLDKIELKDSEYCYHAGTKEYENKIYAIGGRVLNFVSMSNNFLESRNQVLKLIKMLNWNEGFFRKDIGYKVISE